MYTKQGLRLLQLLAESHQSETPLVFTVPGSGLSASSAVKGGIPFLMVLNSGVYRTAGISSQASFLPFGNANDQVETLIRTQILPRCPLTPLVAGLLANDPVCSLPERFHRLKSLGVAGIMNWPPVSMNDGAFLAALRRRGFSEKTECAMLIEAKAHDFVTFGFAASPESAELLAPAKLDGLVINVGWTLHDSEPLEKQDRIQYAIKHTNKIIDRFRATGKSDPVYFFYGGGVTTAQDTLQLYQQTPVDGFGAGSAVEYFPVRDLLQGISREFLSISKKKTLLQNIDTLHPSFVGNSPVMLNLYRIIRRLSAYNVSVCIEGESGAGKELVATMLHALSQRNMQPFITVNCGAIPESLVESELFGHERGAFTGATERRLGKFELANHGTLFLDEVAELSPKAQVCLLRAIQQKEIVRVGGRKNIPVDVRIITATNRSLHTLAAQGLFREDLFYRLNTTTLQVPPLRERIQDIDVLTTYFLQECQKTFHCPAKTLSKHFLHRLKQYTWPGNVRELQHVIMEASIMEDGPILMGYGFVPKMHTIPKPDSQPIAPVATRLLEALEKSGGNKAKAARMLGVSRKTVYAWLEKSMLESSPTCIDK